MKTVLIIVFAAALAASAASAAVLILQPGAEGKDARLDTRIPYTNYGTSPFLTVNRNPNWPNRGIVEFTGLSAIPAKSTINSAKLVLWKADGNKPKDNFGIYRVTASWQEMAVTWTNQPAHNSTAYAKTFVLGARWYEWDVKTLVQEWVNRTYPNYGFKLIRDNESGDLWPMFVSSDYRTGTNHPQLLVYYTGIAVAPASLGRVKALFR